MSSNIKDTQPPSGQAHMGYTLICNKEKYSIQFTNLSHSVVPRVAHWNSCDMEIISAVHIYVPETSRRHSASQWYPRAYESKSFTVALNRILHTTLSHLKFIHSFFPHSSKPTNILLNSVINYYLSSDAFSSTESHCQPKIYPAVCVGVLQVG